MFAVVVMLAGQSSVHVAPAEPATTVTEEEALLSASSLSAVALEVLAVLVRTVSAGVPEFTL